MEQEVPNGVRKFRGMADKALEALTECFCWQHISAGMIGVGVAFVLGGAAGTMAAICLVREKFAVATMMGILAGFLVYIGFLVTYGALARLSVVGRNGGRITIGEALGFALARVHILVGVPLFVLVVALGVGSLGAFLGRQGSASENFGAEVAPLALVALFVINLLLLCAVFLTHSLTGPCVAYLDPSFIIVLSRLYQVGRNKLGAFFAHQVAVLLAGIPLMALTLIIFGCAFQPAFQATATGRVTARREERLLEKPILPGISRSQETEERAEGWVQRTQSWPLGALDAGNVPLLSAGAVLVLLLTVLPLIFVAAAQSSVYGALTGDSYVAVRSELQQPHGAAVVAERHPPIVHCWRCDAINRFEASVCIKCQALLVTCLHCYATNEPDREFCSSCGQRVRETRSEVGEAPTNSAETTYTEPGSEEKREK
ncbi:MAG: hypothetical protein ACUVX8_10915 [Candidatus Zipacnadales bacterium]